MLNNEAPRRCYVEKMVPAELKIREAVILVEDMGADVRLTDAVVLLGQAKDRVADFVDGIGEHASFSTKEKFACICGETTYLLEKNPNHFVGCISHNPSEVEKLKAEVRLANANFEVMKGLYDEERETSRKLVELLAEALFFWGQFPEFKFDFATYGLERFEKWKDETKTILKDTAIGNSPDGVTP